MAEAGLERRPKTMGKTGPSATGGAKSDAKDVELRRITADLQSQLTTEDCQRLAGLLLDGQND